MTKSDLLDKDYQCQGDGTIFGSTCERLIDPHMYSIEELLDDEVLLLCEDCKVQEAAFDQAELMRKGLVEGW